MAHAQKQDFVFRRNRRVHLNRRGHQFSRLLAAEVCASAVVMLDTLCFEVVWRVLATHSIPQFPLHFLSIASPCAFTFQLDSTILLNWVRLSLPLIVTSSANGSVLVALLGIKFLDSYRQSSSSVCSIIYRLFSLFLLFAYIFKDYLFLNFIMYILPS